jgi:hypothetical protein
MVGPLVDRSDRADNFAGSGGVVSFLRIYALIYPYTERAIFVQQALDCFLAMMGQIELTENV